MFARSCKHPITFQFPPRENAVLVPCCVKRVNKNKIRSVYPGRQWTQPGRPSVGRRSEYQQKLGRKQAHWHSALIRGFAA